jgi:hypothetical protein
MIFEKFCGKVFGRSTKKKVAGFLSLVVLGKVGYARSVLVHLYGGGLSRSSSGDGAWQSNDLWHEEVGELRVSAARFLAGLVRSDQAKDKG